MPLISPTFLPVTAAVAFVAARLVFPRRSAVHVEPREANLAALRDSWAELERDVAAGLLSADLRETARAELTGRAAHELAEVAPAPAPRLPAPIAAAVAAAAIPLAAFAFYQQVGSPVAIGTAEAFASIEGPLTPERLPAFRDQLAKHVAGSPADGRAWALLGRVDLALERYGEAAAAFENAVRSSRKVAADADIWIDYAEAVGMAEGRTLVGRPATFISKALEIDPAHPRALELAGSLATEKGDHRGAALHWKALHALLDADDPRRTELSRAITRAERMAQPGRMTPR